MSNRMQVVFLSSRVRIFHILITYELTFPISSSSSFLRRLLTATLAHVCPVANFLRSSCPVSYDTLLKSVWDSAHRFMICELIDKPYVCGLVDIFIALGISTHGWVWIWFIWLSLWPNGGNSKSGNPPPGAIQIKEFPDQLANVSCPRAQLFGISK